MDGADYMTFDGLIVRNTANNGNVKGFRIQNATDYLTIKNCTIEFSTLTTTSTTSSAYIAYSTSSTSATTTSTTNHGSFNLIEKNLMRTTNVNSVGPAFGIAMQGSTSTYSYTPQDNTITGNTIQNFHFMAIRLYWTNGCQVLSNDISRANATSYNSSATLYGIYSYYSYATSRATKLDGNNLHDMPFFGATPATAPSTMYAFYTYYNYGNASYKFTINNNNIKNVMASNNNYLGYNYFNYYFDLIGNMADNNDVTTSTSSAFNFHGWLNYGSYNEYRFNNNTIQNCDGGYRWYGIRNEYPNGACTVAQINGNTIKNNAKGYFYHYSIFSQWTYNSALYPVQINENTIEGNTSDYYYHYSIYAYFYGNYDISRNIIRNNRNTSNSTSYYHYSIYNYYNYNTTINSNLIVDNAAYYYTYCIYNYSFISGTYTTDVRQNTVRANGSLTNNFSPYLYGIYQYQYYHTSIRVIGNIFDFQNWYGFYPVYTYNVNGSTPYTWDHNSYYVNNFTSQNWYCPAGTATSFAGWANNGFCGPNEKFINAGHNYATNFASNRFLNQNNVPTVSSNSKDVYGVIRNPSKSDRGAVEGVLDIAQTANNFNPPSPVCAGYTTSPTVTFQNNFAEPVTGFTVAMSDNGVVKATAVFTNTIAVSGTNTVTFPPIAFSQAGAHKVKFFLLSADDLPSNDTMTFNFSVLKSPGGGVLTQNTSLSSSAAMFKTTGKPDITFPDEKLVYDLSAPSTVGYTDADYGASNKWVGTVTAKTINGTPANATVSTNNAAPFKVTLDAPRAWEDSTIELSIKITDRVSGCDTVYTRKVFIAPKVVPNAKLPAALCEKSDLIFESTSTVSSGSIDYEWDFGDGSPKSQEASPAHRYASFGQYTLTLKTTSNPLAFTTTKTFVIDITEVPIATIINTNACEGVAVKLKNATVYGGSGAITYAWDYGDGSAVNTTNSKNDIFKNYSTPGGYKVTLTASADGCTNTTNKVVYQFAKPKADFAQTSGNCLNTEFNFDNKSTISLGQFGNLWDFDDAGNRATVDEPTYTFVTAGTKNVKLEVVSEFGCVDSKTIPVLVKQTPTTGFTLPFACSRTATPFTNTTKLNNETLQSYFWNFGDGFTSTATSPVKSWTSIGPRIVSLTTYLVNGCSTTESKTVDVGVQPFVNFSVEDRCAGSEVPFANQTTYAQGNITYKWNFGDGNFSSKTAPVHAYGSGVSQTYTVQLKASILNGCADSISKTVTINPLPTTCNFNITGNLNAAKKSALVFTPIGGASSGISYKWITGDGNSVNSNGTGASYTYNAPGKYCVTMIATNLAGCECTTTKCVTMSTSINDAESMNNAVSVYPNPNGGNFNVSLSAEISGDMTVNVYNTLGVLVQTITVNSNSTNVDMSEFASGVYVVKVIAENQIATKKITIAK
jgi:PKD repeat protein